MQEKQLLELTGTVEEIVFSNENNGYKILELKAGEELITVVGTLPWVGCGEELRVIGTWIHHPSFGQQFKAEAFERSAPKTADAILRYLSLKVNTNSHLIDNEKEIDPSLLQNVNSIGVCGATSTPKWLMEKIYNHIRTLIKE